MSQAWSEVELDAIVRDYLHMLVLEQQRKRYSKASHRRSLMRVINRSNGSIERKHMNISAVLTTMGLPFIDGYKPYRNFQHALYDAVEHALARDTELYRLLAADDVQEPGEEVADRSAQHIIYDCDPPERWIPAPSRSTKKKRNTFRFQSPAERDSRNRNLGRAGEALVYRAERDRLRRLGYPALADRVRWVARDDGDGYGFDVLSYDGTGDKPNCERWLEVKTTNGPKTTPFFLTRNELDTSNDRSDVYRLIRPYNYKTQVRAYRLDAPLDTHLALRPMIFTARPK